MVFFDNFWTTLNFLMKFGQCAPNMDWHLLTKFRHQWWRHRAMLTSANFENILKVTKLKTLYFLLLYIFFNQTLSTNFTWQELWTLGKILATCQICVFYRPECQIHIFQSRGQYLWAIFVKFGLDTQIDKMKWFLVKIIGHVTICVFYRPVCKIPFWGLSRSQDLLMQLTWNLVQL